MQRHDPESMGSVIVKKLELERNKASTPGINCCVDQGADDKPRTAPRRYQDRNTALRTRSTGGGGGMTSKQFRPLDKRSKYQKKLDAIYAKKGYVPFDSIEISQSIKPCMIHRWVTVHDNGFTSYMECWACKERSFWQRDGGYQPVDKNWLNHKKEDL